MFRLLQRGRVSIQSLHFLQHLAPKAAKQNGSQADIVPPRKILDESKYQEEMNTYYPPQLNDGKHIFVFGSNLAGRHGAGAALTAHKHWGAQLNVGMGRTGMAYALPTKDRNIKTRPLIEVGWAVDAFIDYARYHPELTFLVTAVGCGLAGFTPYQIAPMFKGYPSNCVMPNEFKKWLTLS